MPQLQNGSWFGQCTKVGHKTSKSKEVCDNDVLPVSVTWEYFSKTSKLTFIDWFV